MTTGDYVDNAINHLYDTEIDPLKAALAARGAIIRELVEATDYLVQFNEYRSVHGSWMALRTKALALITDTPAKQETP